MEDCKRRVASVQRERVKEEDDARRVQNARRSGREDAEHKSLKRR